MISKSRTRLETGSYYDLIKSKQGSKSKGGEKVKEGYCVFLTVGLNYCVLNFHFLISTDSWTDMIYFFGVWKNMPTFRYLGWLFFSLSPPPPPPAPFFFFEELRCINQIVAIIWHVLLWHGECLQVKSEPCQKSLCIFQVYQKWTWFIPSQQLYPNGSGWTGLISSRKANTESGLTQVPIKHVVFLTSRLYISMITGLKTSLWVTLFKYLSLISVPK